MAFGSSATDTRSAVNGEGTVIVDGSPAHGNNASVPGTRAIERHLVRPTETDTVRSMHTVLLVGVLFGGMYRRILLPTDGGETTDDALEHAVDLAGQYDAELHVLYVVDASVVAGDIEVGTIVEEFESAGERILEDVAERAHEAGLERDRITTKLARGTPHRVILEYTADQDVDLIVMGTHGRTGIGRYLLGSVTERVVRLADVPVVTVRRANS